MGKGSGGVALWLGGGKKSALEMCGGGVLSVLTTSVPSLI